MRTRHAPDFLKSEIISFLLVFRESEFESVIGKSLAFTLQLLLINSDTPTSSIQSVVSGTYDTLNARSRRVLWLPVSQNTYTNQLSSALYLNLLNCVYRRFTFIQIYQIYKNIYYIICGWLFKMDLCRFETLDLVRNGCWYEHLIISNRAIPIETAAT